MAEGALVTTDRDVGKDQSIENKKSPNLELFMKRHFIAWIIGIPLLAGLGEEPAGRSRLTVWLSWGHQARESIPFWIQFRAHEVSVADLKPVGFETADSVQDGICQTRAGAGDVDTVGVTLSFPNRPVEEIKNLQQIWRYLLDTADADTARRLREDPGYRPDPRKLTVQMNESGTKGFSLTVDQLLNQSVFWVPELDVLVNVGDRPAVLAEHLASLERWRGQRVLEQVKREPEPDYESFTSRWEDMGSPSYRNPHSVGPGHIVGLTWDSAIPKFGVDRGANVWSDYGNPDRFYLGWSFGDLNRDLAKSWRSQKLDGGWPIILTTFEKEGVRYEVEQFAYPLSGPPDERRGDLAMVLLQKLQITELTGQAQNVALGLIHRRELATNTVLAVQPTNHGFVWEMSPDHSALLTLEGHGLELGECDVQGAGRWKTNRCNLTVALPARGAREFIWKLPSAPVPPTELGVLRALEYETARARTVDFWSNYLARGAQFVVPDEAVNTLFRANLWHALRLPRRHGGAGSDVKIDLPYSNFAYDQKGTPWPVNQAIYVDYMLYDLRGYHGISAEELAAMFRNNQEPNGHVGGFANWGVYTPSMLYAVAKHYLLSGDRASFENLLPQSLKAFDWCLSEIRKAAGREGPTAGLVLAPLNDLSHDPKAWAFNQAYLFAGPDLLARALSDIGHPRAAEARAAAQTVFNAVQRAFAHASMLSPLIPLRDHTWMPYVPGDALTPRRLLEVWYPTDVDSGPLHLSRLQALDPVGPLTTYLLHDHEDNLFYRQWGMANEPVYNQQASAYLWRDEPKPAIRAFYSMLACAFSHAVFEPVEHRWGWGQYFGPPSTDGAWFELYRNMLLQEHDDGSLRLGQAMPRRWLEEGKRIRVERAPSYYGPISVEWESRAASGQIDAVVKGDWRKTPGLLWVRFRHPAALPMRSVRVNDRPWADFDPSQERVRIPEPTEPRYHIRVQY